MSNFTNKETGSRSRFSCNTVSARGPLFLTLSTNTALVVAGKSLVLGTEDGYLNWIAIDSGDVKKRVRLEEGRPYGTPILASPLLFVSECLRSRLRS